jgi:hypothetical protein
VTVGVRQSLSIEEFVLLKAMKNRTKKALNDQLKTFLSLQIFR